MIKRLIFIVFIIVNAPSIVTWGTNVDPYNTLGIQPTADLKTIKKAYRALVMKYHPDRNKAPGAEERLKEIILAYNLVSKAAEAGEVFEATDPVKVMSFNEINAELERRLSSNKSFDHIQAIVLLQEYVTRDTNWENQVEIFERAGAFVEDLLDLYKDRPLGVRLKQELVRFFERAAEPMHHFVESNFVDSNEFYSQRELFLNIEARFIQKLVLQESFSTRQFINEFLSLEGGLPDRSISTFAYRFLTAGAMLNGEIHDYESYINFEKEIRRLRGFGDSDKLLTSLDLFPDIAEKIIQTADTFEKLELLSRRFGIGGVKLSLKRRLMEVAIEKKLVLSSENFVSILQNLVGDHPKYSQQSLRLELVSEFRKTDNPSKNWDSYFYIAMDWSELIPLHQRIWLKKAPLGVLKPFVQKGPLTNIDRTVARNELKKMSEKRFTGSTLKGASCSRLFAARIEF